MKFHLSASLVSACPPVTSGLSCAVRLVSLPALAQIIVPPKRALDAQRAGREAHLLFLHADVLERADSDSLQLTAGGERDIPQLPAVPESSLPWKIPLFRFQSS